MCGLIVCSGALGPEVAGGFGSGCDGLWSPALVAVPGEAVDHEREADEVEVLAFVADAVSASEPEAVVESAVDAFGVVAAAVEQREVWVASGDGPKVFGAVELAARVFVGAVEPDRDSAAAEVV